MYAVIVSGGKQHRVVEGETLKLEKLESATGETIQFDQVLMIRGDTPVIGTPVLESATVKGEVVAHGRHDKVKIMKFNRRKHHMKQAGHRQWYTEVKITEIKA